MPDTFDLAAVRAACEGHTPGDWRDTGLPIKHDRAIVAEHDQFGPGPHLVAKVVRTNNEHKANAALIALAPRLLSECERLTGEVDRLNTMLDEQHKAYETRWESLQAFKAERDKYRGLLKLAIEDCDGLGCNKISQRVINQAQTALAPGGEADAG